MTHKGKSIILDGNHRFNTAKKLKDLKQKFRYIELYALFPENIKK